MISGTNKGDAQTGEAWYTDEPGIDTSNATAITKQKINTVSDTFIKADTELTFTNTKDGTVPTEIRLDKYAWMPVVLAALIGLIIILRRKRLRDDE